MGLNYQTPTKSQHLQKPCKVLCRFSIIDTELTVKGLTKPFIHKLHQNWLKLQTPTKMVSLAKTLQSFMPLLA
jgi:hypothetical protein